MVSNSGECRLEMAEKGPRAAAEKWKSENGKWGKAAVLRGVPGRDGERAFAALWMTGHHTFCAERGGAAARSVGRLGRAIRAGFVRTSHLRSRLEIMAGLYFQGVRHGF